MTWSPSVTGDIVTYVVEAGSVPGLSNLYNAPVGATTSVTAQPPPGAYYVRVRAQNACGTSPPSPERAVIVP